MALCEYHHKKLLAALDHVHPAPTHWISHGDPTGERSIETLAAIREARAKRDREYMGWIKRSCAAGEGCGLPPLTSTQLVSLARYGVTGDHLKGEHDE